jgi:long-chain acyl-CoA synthetase
VTPKATSGQIVPVGDQTNGESAADEPTGRDDRTLGRTAAWLAKQVELGLAAADLSLSQYRVLGLLDGSAAVSSDLAERLAVSPPSVTAVIDGLVGRGLVERRTVVADRRQVQHVLTPAGRRALDTADAGVATRLVEIAHCLSDEDEAGRAFDGLVAWRRALRAYRSERHAHR